MYPHARDGTLVGMENHSEQAHNILQSFVSDGTCEAVRQRYAALPKRAETADYGTLDDDIIVLDTETTGFSFSRDELTQVAAARMNKGKIIEWFVRFVNPGKHIPEEVSYLTNIYDADVAEASEPNEVLAQLVEFVGVSKIVAHNANFDRTFTTKHSSGKSLNSNLWIDSLDLARIALPRMKSHRLLDLVRAFGAPLSTHRADADVASTCAVYRILLAAVEAMPPLLIREIASMASTDQWPTRVVFEYFASHRAEEAVKSANLSLKAASHINSTENQNNQSQLFQAQPSRLSLAFLRRARLATKTRHTKEDADSIAADINRQLVFPDARQIAQAFSSQGLLGGLYHDYEQRHEQVVMAEEVRTAFEASENLVIEAGTGVGKSMAYLVPAALTAQKNNISLGVATKTNALLDQLVYHELPALADALEKWRVGEKKTAKNAQDNTTSSPLSYAALKGYTHYPCLRKIGRIMAEGPASRMVRGEEVLQAPSLAALLSFIEQTEYDDIDSLKIDYRALPRKIISTTSTECLRRKCPFFGSGCFVHGARRFAEQADVVVTNHSLLFCDVAADGGLLPPIRYWVVDEAHGAEIEARRAFSRSLEADSIVKLASRVTGTEGSSNVFSRAEKRISSQKKYESASLFYALLGKARLEGQNFADDACSFAAHLKDLLFFDTSRRGKNYEYVELWINQDIRRSETFDCIVSFGRRMALSAQKLATLCQELVGYLEEIENAASVQREIATLAIELKELIESVEVILVKAPDEYAYAATIYKKVDRPFDKLEALLLNVGEALNDTLYRRTHSVVFASATLAIDESFNAFERALGLNTDEYSHTRSKCLNSSFDFDNNMTIYVASDMPEPNEPGYLAKLQELLIASHCAQQGSFLTLFTNRREMERCFNVVQPALKCKDLRVVCQKWGVSVKGLRDEFLSDETLSLFALKSFWEGFDAPGSTLKGVIIPKLPFAKPSDPLSCERAIRDDQAWRHYVLPQAVLETKQAAGRLIRKANDKGVLIFSDKRLLTKGYGKLFLKSMPSRTVKVLSCAEIVTELTLHARDEQMVNPEHDKGLAPIITHQTT